MLLFLIALICSTAVLFAGIPAACNNANRIHIENGRKPNAGIAFMPELIVMVALWWGAGAGLKYFFGLTASLIVVLAVSAIMFIWQILEARKSNREYAQFLGEHELGMGRCLAKQTQEAEQGVDPNA